MNRPQAAKPWKPKRCADCRRPHPTHNRDGGKAGTPWRCGPCDAVASPLPPDSTFLATPAPRNDAQGSLL